MTEKEVLAINSIQQLEELRIEDWEGREITPTEITHLFKLCDAFWMHSGNPTDPHAELTSGFCSNGYINCLMVFSYTNLCQIIADQAVRKLRKVYDGPVDWALGSAYAALDFSKDVANLLGARHAPLEKGENKEQLWRRLEIRRNEVVLQVEELMTTSGTTKAVNAGIEKGNPVSVAFAPVILVAVHRSQVYEIDGRKVIYLAHYDIWTSHSKDCKLCRAGSRRLRPKTHWAELTGKK